MIQVETFEMQEAPKNMDDCAEFRRIIEDLGLNGQKDLVSEDKKDIMPYRKMTMLEWRVYSRYLDRHESVETYSSGPIPLRVLQVLEHAKSLNYFTSFQIWRNSEDPLLVGRKGSDEYLLARWGEELESFPLILKKMADAHRKKCQGLLSACDDAELFDKFGNIY